MPIDIPSEILEWSQQQPKWQRDCLRRLFKTGPVTSQDLDELTEICKTDHGLSSKGKATPLSKQDLPIGGAVATDDVSLVSLTHHDGVNALAPNQTVSFGSALTIVYGENAAGKSGYSRILKLACRSRRPENILGNVLAGTPLKASATIRARTGASETDVAWAPDSTSSSSLAQVSVFDSRCVPAYLGDKTDVAFRPFGLDLFDALAAACAEVKKRLTLASQAIASPLIPATPGLLPGTKARQLVDTLSALTKEQQVESLATLTGDEQKRLKELRELKQDLDSKDPKKRAGELNSKATRLDAAAAHLSTMESALNGSALSTLVSARSRLQAALVTLKNVRDAALTADVLPGTGGAQWRAMWNEAEKFSAQGSVAFPPKGVESKCPLCQQGLHDDAQARLQHFAAFVHSKAQAEANTADEEFKAALRRILELNVHRDEVDGALEEAASDDPALGPRAAQYMESALNVQGQVQSLKADSTSLVASTFDKSVEEAVRAQAQSLRARAKQLLASATSLSALEQKELNELESRTTLNDNLDAILAEIDRRRRLSQFDQCQKETNTLATSKKSSELTKLLVSDQLKAAFGNELTRLDFTHLAVEIKEAGAAKGAMFHQLVFSNAPGVKVTDVLSEGESRALSLAAFLTELSTAQARSAIIFDDPVSSLDHIWQGKIGRRLVAEAKDRQVIVLTHDIVFLQTLLSECEKQAVQVNHQYIRRGAAAGISSPELPYAAMKVKDRIAALKKSVHDAKGLLNKNDLSGYETKGREIFGLLRSAWEKSTEEVLLNGAVERYRPSIETKRVSELHDITEQDYKTLEDGMAECSRWFGGHDTAAADGTPFPQPNQIEARIKELDDWVKGIRKRRE